MKTCSIFAILFIVFSCTKALNFTNPVLRNYTLPGVIKVENVYYMVVSNVSDPSNPTNNIAIFSSTNLNEWKSVGNAFDPEDEPKWAKKGIGQTLYSPEIHFVNGVYNLYYTAVKKEGESCFGVATGKTVTGPYKDKGHPLLEEKGKILTYPTLVRSGKKILLFPNKLNFVFD